MRSLILPILLLLSLSLPSCAKVPPNLGPAATVAFHQHQVQKALDLIRDIVQDGNAAQPAVFTTATTRTVTVWHKSTITIIHAAGTGWQSTITTSLDELVTHLSPTERATLAPYVALAKTLIQELRT